MTFILPAEDSVPDRVTIRIQPQSALSRLIAAGKADGRTVAATLHDAVTRLEVMERYASAPVNITAAPARRCEQRDHRYEPGPYGVCKRCGGEKT